MSNDEIPGDDVPDSAEGDEDRRAYLDHPDHRDIEDVEDDE